MARPPAHEDMHEHECVRCAVSFLCRLEPLIDGACTALELCSECDLEVFGPYVDVTCAIDDDEVLMRRDRYTRNLAMVVAAVVRDHLEAQHGGDVRFRLTDAELRRIDPLLRDAIYSALWAHDRREESWAVTWLGLHADNIPPHCDPPELTRECAGAAARAASEPEGDLESGELKYLTWTRLGRAQIEPDRDLPTDADAETVQVPDDADDIQLWISGESAALLRRALAGVDEADREAAAWLLVQLDLAADAVDTRPLVDGQRAEARALRLRLELDRW